MIASGNIAASPIVISPDKNASPIVIGPMRVYKPNPRVRTINRELSTKQCTAIKRFETPVRLKKSEIQRPGVKHSGTFSSPA
jgi:hypothetical protein